VFETAILGVVRVVATNEPVVEAAVEFGITFYIKLDIKLDIKLEKTKLVDTSEPV
jgi:hypothetical protein